MRLQCKFDPILAKNRVHTAHYSKFMLDGQYLLSHITSNFRSYNGFKYVMKWQFKKKPLELEFRVKADIIDFFQEDLASRLI